MLTARQYGEVVLPDEASGQGTGTLGINLTRCEEGMARGFCSPGTNFITCWRDPGTSFIGAANSSPVTKVVEGTGAVSRYNLSRSKKTVKVDWILIAYRCACPGAEPITNLSLVQE